MLHAADLGGGPATFALLILALTGGTALGIRTARKVLPALSRRRLLALAVAVTGVALLALGLVPDTATGLLVALLAGYAAGVAAHIGHAVIDQETEAFRQARVTEHLQAVVRVLVALGAVGGPLLAAAIGRHRLGSGDFVFAHGGAAFALMLIGALLLPVAVIVLARTDDRAGVPLRRDLREALRGGDPAVAPAANGFFLVLEGGDGAEVHPGRGARRMDPGQGPRGRRDPRAGGHPGRQAAALDPAGRLVGRSVEPGRGTAVRRRPRRARRLGRPAGCWSAARSSSPTATSTPPSPTRARAVTSPRPRSPGSRAGRRAGSYRI